MSDVLPALVIGAGPAGLATSAELVRRGVRHLVLERAEDVGHSWANAYDSLTLHTGRHLSWLPGMRFPRGTPLFPTRLDFLDYLRRYARRFALPVEARAGVLEARREGDLWVARTAAGELRARSLVWAAGIMASPRIPSLPGRGRFGGRILHSVEYRRPDGFAERRVLVVGVGNSGGEIGSELARHGARVTVAVRSGANVVPRQIAGVPTQYLAMLIRRLPRRAQLVVAERIRAASERRRGPPVLPRPAHGALEAIPLIGFALVDAIREGLITVRPGIAELTERGARFTDGREEPFDDILLATGFVPALGPLGGVVTTDAKGFAVRRDRVTSAAHPTLHFVGHNYDSRGGLYNIRIDAPVVAARVAG